MESIATEFGDFYIEQPIRSAKYTDGTLTVVNTYNVVMQFWVGGTPKGLIPFSLGSRVSEEDFKTLLAHYRLNYHD